MQYDVRIANRGTGRQAGSKPGPLSSKGAKGRARGDSDQLGPSRGRKESREEEVLEISDTGSLVRGADSRDGAEEREEEGYARVGMRLRKEPDAAKRKLVVRTSDSEMEEEEAVRKRGRPATTGEYVGLAVAKNATMSP